MWPGCGLSDWVSVYFFLVGVCPEYEERRLGGCAYFFGGCGLSERETPG